MQGIELSADANLQRTDEAVSLSDANGIVRYANSAYFELYGLTPEQVIGQSFAIIFPEPQRADAVKHYKVVYDSRMSEPIFKRNICRADGTELTVESRVDFIEDGQHGVLMRSTIRDVTEQSAAETLLQELAQRLVQVQKAERSLIAAELHNEIGQLLLVVKSTADRLPDLSIAVAQTRLNEALVAAQRLFERIRDLSHDLHPAILEFQGLVPALQEHFNDYTARTGVRVIFNCNIGYQRFEPTIEDAVYRITQEAITNAAKYARTSEVTVTLSIRRKTLRLQISDTGVGFDANHRLNGSSLGLVGMREHTLAVDGDLTINAIPGSGTRINVKIPLDQPD